MKKEKYILTEINRKELRSLRKNCGIAAEDVSVELGYSKAWLGQIERGKLQTIKQDDLAKILSLYCPEWTPEEIIKKDIINNFLKYNFLVESMDEYLGKLRELDIADYFFKCIDQLSMDEEKANTYKDIEYFMYCLYNYPGSMTTFLSNVPLFSFILDNYSILPPDQFLSNVNAFTKKLTNLLREEHDRSEYLVNEYLKQKKDV